tara:strand:- start:1526 stop:2773 length:1248 start_codon:yes stop_codon:yes gene_type:complete
MAGMSLEEYVNAYYGGLLGISKEYGISKADDIMDTGKDDYFNTMYGAKVFSQLNNESSVFKLLPKQPWNSSGWRILYQRSTAAAASASPQLGTGGVGEGLAFPDTDTPDIAELSADMKEVVTAWDITTKASTLSKADDGLGDIEGFLKENAATDHAYYIDQMLMKDHATLPSNNFESLDRLVGAYAETLTRTGSGSDVDAGDLDPYGATGTAASAGGLSRDEAASDWLDSQVSMGSITSNLAVARALSLDLLDTVIGDALEAGAKYENLILVTGYDTLEVIKQKINTASNATWRMMMDGTQAGKNVGGVTSMPGANLDTRVGYYDSIPIFVTQHCTKAALAGSGTSGIDTALSNIFLLDLENIHFRVAVPTTYVANEDLGVTQKLAREYAFITGGEVIMTRFNTHGKVRDLEIPA